MKRMILIPTILLASTLPLAVHAAKQSGKTAPAKTTTATASRAPASAEFKIPVPGKLEPFEGVDVVLQALEAFKEVCLDRDGKIIAASVTNARMLADDNDGAIDCQAAAYKIGLHLRRIEADRKAAEADPAVAKFLEEIGS